MGFTKSTRSFILAIKEPRCEQARYANQQAAEPLFKSWGIATAIELVYRRYYDTVKNSG